MGIITQDQTSINHSSSQDVFHSQVHVPVHKLEPALVPELEPALVLVHGLVLEPEHMLAAAAAAAVMFFNRNCVQLHE